MYQQCWYTYIYICFLSFFFGALLWYKPRGVCNVGERWRCVVKWEWQVRCPGLILSLYVTTWFRISWIFKFLKYFEYLIDLIVGNFRAANWERPYGRHEFHSIGVARVVGMVYGFDWWRGFWPVCIICFRPCSARRLQFCSMRRGRGPTSRRSPSSFPWRGQTHPLTGWPTQRFTRYEWVIFT